MTERIMFEKTKMKMILEIARYREKKITQLAVAVFFKNAILSLRAHDSRSTRISAVCKRGVNGVGVYFNYNPIY